MGFEPTTLCFHQLNNLHMKSGICLKRPVYVQIFQVNWHLDHFSSIKIENSFSLDEKGLIVISGFRFNVCSCSDATL